MLNVDITVSIQKKWFICRPPNLDAISGFSSDSTQVGFLGLAQNKILLKQGCDRKSFCRHAKFALFIAKAMRKM